MHEIIQVTLGLLCTQVPQPHFVSWVLCVIMNVIQDQLQQVVHFPMQETASASLSIIFLASKLELVL